MNIHRKKTKKIRIGNLYLGDNEPIRVQSMTKTDTRDIKKTVRQIKELEAVGCEIIRCAVPDQESAVALGKIKKAINIPLVADIHFDYRLALEAIKQGVDKIRINPGNIGSRERVGKIVLAAKERNIPIRIGVNAGSLKLTTFTPHQKMVRGKPNHLTTNKAQAMVDSAMEYVRMIEDMGFEDIVISLKAADVLTTVESYRLFAQRSNYPLHLGITEAGTVISGAIKSAVGMGLLLAEGIGDTIRVSLTTTDPREEVKAGYEILRSLGLRNYGIEIISCPTCSRCQIDLVKIVNALEKKVIGYRLLVIGRPLKVAVMGCIVNGPGEAKDADIGIAGGRGVGLLFKQGKPIKKIPEKDWLKTLLKEIEILTKNKKT
jgi:(E)-4-hydroxy-3-methylbut-2-enyl-diphosphate synthase